MTENKNEKQKSLTITSTNELGIRESLDTVQLSKLSHQAIAVLGNSVVAGHAFDLDKTFTKQIAAKLLKITNQHFYLLNFGYDGFEIYREFDTFATKSNELPIRYVVWIPGISDRVTKAFVEEKIAESNKQNAITHQAEQRSFNETVLTGFYKQLAQLVYVDRHNRQLKFTSSDHNVYYSSGMTDPLKTEVLEDVRDAIKNFHAQMKSRNIKLLVVFLPPMAFRLKYGWSQATFFQSIAQILDQQNIPYLQLLDRLHENKNHDYFIDYVHLNEAGHELVSREISNYLAKNLNTSY